MPPPAASPRAALVADADQAVAIAAAIERFRRDTAPAPRRPLSGLTPWQQAALLEGTGRALGSGPSAGTLEG